MNKEQFLQWCHTPKTPTSMQIDRPLIMGVLNITPDSFSDGGCFLEEKAACRRAQEMIEQGADLIDIGGESTRPGTKPVSCMEELQRVIPVIERIRKISDICISIDTYKPEVMEAAVKAGASVINDVKALTLPGAISTAAALKVPVCLMHMQGDPLSMQDNPLYENGIIEEINDYFSERITACLAKGILREHLILDPGFGFGKSVEHNLMLVKRLKEFRHHQLPLLLGVSRKSTIGAVLQQKVTERLSGGLAIAIFAALQGVSMIRTHDIKETSQALQMLDAIVNT